MAKLNSTSSRTRAHGSHAKLVGSGSKGSTFQNGLGTMKAKVPNRGASNQAIMTRGSKTHEFPKGLAKKGANVSAPGKMNGDKYKGPGVKCLKGDKAVIHSKGPHHLLRLTGGHFLGHNPARFKNKLTTVAKGSAQNTKAQPKHGK